VTEIHFPELTIKCIDSTNMQLWYTISSFHIIQMIPIFHR